MFSRVFLLFVFAPVFLGFSPLRLSARESLAKHYSASVFEETGEFDIHLVDLWAS